MKSIFYILVNCSIFLSIGQGFTENKGQVLLPSGEPNEEVLFLGNSNNISVSLRKNGFSYEIKQLEERPQEIQRKIRNTQENSKFTYHVERIDFLFPKQPEEISKLSPSKDYANFYGREKPVLKVRSYESVIYHEIANGIDIEFLFRQNKFKYNVIVHPGASLDDFFLLIDSDQMPSLKNGDLLIKTEFGEIKEQIPLSYYTENNQTAKAAFMLTDRILKFRIENRISDQTLVIDPVPDLIWNTYFGGDQYDITTDITLDNGDSIFQTGITMSGSNIATSGAHQTSYQGDLDAYVSKFDPYGNLIWSTYYAGPQTERAYNIVTDQNNNCYLGGSTFSQQDIATAGAHQTYVDGGDDMFLVKFSPSGTREWATYHGGNAHDFITDMICRNDTLFMTGHTTSTNNIASPNAFLQVNNANEAGHITLFSTSGSFLWGTFLGENGNNSGEGIAVNNNIICVTGRTTSTTGISTSGVHQETIGGFADAFLMSFSKAGTINWGTYFGGTYTDVGKQVVMDENNKIYMCGNTASLNQIATPGAHQENRLTSEQVFVACFSPQGLREWGTYTGGTDSDYLSQMLYYEGKIMVGGQTLSGTEITTTGVFQESIIGGYDAFIQQFDTSGTFEWGTYFGSTANEELSGLRLNSLNQIILSGFTSANDPNFASVGSYQTSFAGGAYDGYLAYLCLPVKSTISYNNGQLTASSAIDYDWHYEGSPLNLYDQTISSQGDGNYYVVTSNQGRCKDTSEIFSLSTIGLNNNISEQNIKIYPNPFSEKIIIENKGNYTLEISDLHGKIIQSYFRNETSELNLRYLAKGTYLVILKSSDYYISKKIIKN
ncbi:MAG: T9SS type A sorting domain-containing protein [Brumimicrobium sp.]|nr:T9SS type A sorting domain-containing protein [Brumimicrobium sp.]